MKVLLTGHLGYIGSILGPMLQSRDHDVVGFDSDLFAGCTYCGKLADISSIDRDLRDARVEDFAGFDARWLHRRLGLNVAIPVMPLHCPRRVGRRGGDGFLTGDFIDTIHAQAQAVWDVRRLIGWLRARGAPTVGIYGVSLGGYTAALLASLEEDLGCVIAGIPASDFLRLMQAHVPSFVVRAATRLGLSLERIRRVLRVVSPLALRPLVPYERRFLYAGLADQLASPDHARDLWQHWDRPHMTWYQGGHVSFLWEDEVRALLRKALSSSGLLSHRSTL